MLTSPIVPGLACRHYVREVVVMRYYIQTEQEVLSDMADTSADLEDYGFMTQDMQRYEKLIYVLMVRELEEFFPGMV